MKTALKHAKHVAAPAEGKGESRLASDEYVVPSWWGSFWYLFWLVPALLAVSLWLVTEATWSDQTRSAAWLFFIAIEQSQTVLNAIGAVVAGIGVLFFARFVHRKTGFHWSLPVAVLGIMVVAGALHAY